MPNLAANRTSSSSPRRMSSTLCRSPIVILWFSIVLAGLISTMILLTHLGSSSSSLLLLDSRLESKSPKAPRSSFSLSSVSSSSSWLDPFIAIAQYMLSKLSSAMSAWLLYLLLSDDWSLLSVFPKTTTTSISWDQIFHVFVNLSITYLFLETKSRLINYLLLDFKFTHIYSYHRCSSSPFHSRFCSKAREAIKPYHLSALNM